MMADQRLGRAPGELRRIAPVEQRRTAGEQGRMAGRSPAVS